MKTDIVHQAHILAEFWISHRDEDQYEDFFSYHDLGLPLAYAYENGFVEISTEVGEMINETFLALLEVLGIQDSGFTDLSQLL